MTLKKKRKKERKKEKKRREEKRREEKRKEKKNKHIRIGKNKNRRKRAPERDTDKKTHSFTLMNHIEILTGNHNIYTKVFYGK